MIYLGFTTALAKQVESIVKAHDNRTVQKRNALIAEAAQNITDSTAYLDSEFSKNNIAWKG